jgi:hypothetical protein
MATITENAGRKAARLENCNRALRNTIILELNLKQ